MVRRRADETDARRGVPGLGDPRVHLVPGQLAALAGLGALGHLDLDVVALVRYSLVTPKRPDATCLTADRSLGVVEPLGVLAALAGVRLATEAVHRDGERLVGLDRDRAVAHRAGGEALDDLRRRLDLVERHRLALALPQLEQAAQRGELARLLVDHLRVLLEDLVLAAAGGVLQLEDGLGVEEVVLPLSPPLVLAAGLELAVGALGRAGRGTPSGAGRDLVGDLVETDAAELRRGAGEVLVDQVRAEADGLEDLRTGVGGDGRDAHLGHHLQHALAGGLDVVRRRRRRGRRPPGPRARSCPRSSRTPGRG